MLNISQSDLNNLTRLNVQTTTPNHHNNNGDIYVDIEGNTLYKIVDSRLFFPDEFERNVDFLINANIPNTPQIHNKIYMGQCFFGYQMDYIQNSMSFRDAIGSNLSLAQRLKAVEDIYAPLKQLHSQNIHLGDIHSDNFLITQNGGYLIDLDYMRFPGDEFKFRTCYDITRSENSPRIIIPSAYTDNVKTMISSLSLLMDTDLETYIEDNNLNLMTLYQNVIIPTNDEGLIDYFGKVIAGQTDEYFDDYLKRDTYFKAILNQSKTK